MPQTRRRTPRPRWQRRPEARPAEIIAAAAEVFATAGFARTKLDDVARRAKVSKGTLYRYFDSKETLFREMVRANVVTLLAAGEEFIRAHRGSSRELLALLIRRMWDSMRDPRRAGIGRLVHSELHDFPELARFYFEEVILRGRRMIQSVLDRGVASGEFRPDLHAFTSRGLPHLMMFSAQTQCFFTTMDPERLGDDQVLAGILDLFLNGVEARPSAGPAA
ncbi:MAG TPA: TetR/AcrR family transcriptional regulator [Gemmatimonadales bacterium]|nr:TetR/AcrR family transcriptional regulator [Gemmatimonadales bacterium]